MPWWEWREGKRPVGWTEADEREWRGDDVPWGPFPPAQRRELPTSRMHVVFDDRGELAEYELAPAPPDDPESAALSRIWAAMMLALDVDTCTSILRGLPVRAGNLDGFVFRRALRGGELPDAEAYIDMTPEMLDAVDEAGPLPEPTTKPGRKR